ncbi:hypothetical protein ACLOJK_030733 [Asimina triloba]
MDANAQRVVEVMVGFGSVVEGAMGVAAGWAKCRSCLAAREVPGLALVVKLKWVAEVVFGNDGWEGEFLGRVEEAPSRWELAAKPKSVAAEVVFGNDGWEGELPGRVEEALSSWELAAKPKSVVAEVVFGNDGWEGELPGRVEEALSSWELAAKPKSVVAEVAFDDEKLAVVEPKDNGSSVVMAAAELGTHSLGEMEVVIGDDRWVVRLRKAEVEVAAMENTALVGLHKLV